MKTASQKTKTSPMAVVLIIVHLPLTALMPMQAGAHVFEHRTKTDHAMAHTLLSCRLACSAFVFMPSPVTGGAQGLSPSFEDQSISSKNAYEKDALSEPSIRGPPEKNRPFRSCRGQAC